MKMIYWDFVESLHRINEYIKDGIISADDIISILPKESDCYIVIYKKEVRTIC